MPPLLECLTASSPRVPSPLLSHHPPQPHTTIASTPTPSLSPPPSAGMENPP
ncbi:hypothetical protein EYF80_067842 [Liparis tanakae]|uniref:Uncharacterized protein n=1 Tax=Liparis tanakae TaxID=230148 RepID=A0A4Z2DZT5_9TELE|nr:hypothetical protein EYF80_067842 [Liparis tanakae]